MSLSNVQADAHSKEVAICMEIAELQGIQEYGSVSKLEKFVEQVKYYPMTRRMVYKSHFHLKIKFLFKWKM